MVATHLMLLALAASSSIAQPHGKRGHMFLHRRQNDVGYNSPIQGAPDIKVTQGDATVSVGQGGVNVSNGNGQDQAQQGNYNNNQDTGKKNDNNNGNADKGATKDNQNSGAQPSGGSFGHGVVYTPYHDDHKCKTDDEIAKDIATIAQNGYKSVRTYGVDCNQVNSVLKACKTNDMKAMIGLFDVGKCGDELKQMSQQAEGLWGNVYAVSVGNEDANKAILAGQDAGSAVGKVTSCQQQAKQALPEAPMVLMPDVFTRYKDNNQLCGDAPVVAVNCHPFFDGGVTADKAGDFLVNMEKVVKDACPGKEVIMAETGWPNAGNTNKNAVPGPDQQKQAIQSICDKFPNVALLSAFDEGWKTNDASNFNAETSWGIFGKNN